MTKRDEWRTAHIQINMHCVFDNEPGKVKHSIPQRMDGDKKNNLLWCIIVYWICMQKTTWNEYVQEYFEIHTSSSKYTYMYKLVPSNIFPSTYSINFFYLIDLLSNWGLRDLTYRLLRVTYMIHIVENKLVSGPLEVHVYAIRMCQCLNIV